MREAFRPSRGLLWHFILTGLTGAVIAVIFGFEFYIGPRRAPHVPLADFFAFWLGSTLVVVTLTRLKVYVLPRLRGR